MSMEALLAKMNDTLELLTARLAAVETKVGGETPVTTTPEMSELERRFKLVKDQLKLSQGESIHYENARAYAPIQEELPKNFVLTDIPKFKGTENPLQHIRSYKEHLALKSVPVSMLTAIFAQSLEEHPRAWFYNLDLKNYPKFEDLTTEFYRHYVDDAKIQTTMRTLEVMTQREKGCFTDFLARWRAKSVKLIKKPEEVDMVNKFVKNLQPAYRNELKYQNFSTFKDLTRIGRQIEVDLRTAEFSKPKGYPGASSSKSKATTSAHHVQAINFLGGTSKKPQHSTPRVFTDIGCTYTHALERLKAQGKLNPIGPTLEPPLEQRPKW
ncbi:uncharacterized protein LOC141613933 [Silene latifolia]|uniref:uncharacterized protein LOC141613933 n=1 Tax=Silene latifolia TaxID=37657 RepID=UPI003D77BC88